MTLNGNTQSSRKIPVWEGVFSSFAEASKAEAGPGFRGDVWRERTVSSARECLDAVDNGRPIPQFYKQRSTMLPPVAATMLAQLESIRVLDFGGGLGIGYMTLLESIPDASSRVEYTVVEVPEICDASREVLKGRAKYLSELPSADSFDLVHSASALQYIADWKQMLGSLLKFRAPYVLLSDVFAGGIPSYVTLQNYYGSRIPHWFLNLDELLNFCVDGGYSLAMRTTTTSRRLDTEDTLPMEDFPENLKLAHSLHLLLKRSA